MAIELDHGGTGFQQARATTTVFVVWLPRKSAHWYLPGPRITSEKQVCVDDACVYAAALVQQPPVRTWTHWLGLAVDAAEEVIRTESIRRNENPQQKAQRADEASWNPTDIHLTLFCLVAIAVFSFLNVMMLVEAYGEWQRHGAVLVCHPKTAIGTYLQGWKAVGYAASLAAPLLIALKALYTMVTRVHRPGFFLQLSLEGLAWAGAMYGLHHARQTLIDSVQRAC
ncbi:hypothetical protein [Acidovorax sp.]|uniref:hypothetical protein n=1 Tax=Acidovorax sp. TaxID=1872122 RepID=UPI0025C12B35|nr:hypothetical protein [Acidovorax sp.]MBL7089395.1 hypothetical protein [Acidovorax sp.]